MNKLLKTVLNILCLLNIILPHSQIFYHDGTRETFRTNYIFNNFELAFTIIPFIVIWLLSQLNKKINSIQFLKIILILLSGIYFMISSFLISTPIQDYIPRSGTYTLLLIFPTLTLFYIVKKAIA